MTSADEIAQLPSEWRVYLNHIAGLVWPGRRVLTFEVDRNEPGDIAGWSNDDLLLLIDQGRIHVAQQVDDLERVRGRAQFLLTTTLGLIVVMFASAKTFVAAGRALAFLFWAIGLLVAGVSLLGAAAVVVTRKDLSAVHVTRLSRQRPPIAAELASSYSRIVKTGNNTVATQITIYRDAVMLLISASACYAVAWLVAVL
jgi:hypothetical protein